MNVIRLVIADDPAIYRQGVRAMLSGVPELEVIGEAATGEEAVAQAAALQPEVILMDLKMPGMNGIEATRRILATSPHIQILVITMFEEDDSVFAAMRAGARGYVLKDADQDELEVSLSFHFNHERVVGHSYEDRNCESTMKFWGLLPLFDGRIARSRS